MKHREELSEDAKKEGEQADAIVSTANSLLQSAKEMSGQAQSEKTASSQVCNII